MPEIQEPKSAYYVRWHVAIHLDFNQEEHIWHNDKGREFFIRHINYSGGDSVAVSGAALLADGGRGVIDRTGVMPLSQMPPVFVAMLLQEIARLLP